MYKRYGITCSFLCVLKKTLQKRHYSESVSKYASFLGSMGFVGSNATEVQFSDLDTQQGRMIFLFTHTHTKQVTDALGSTLSKTREGGDLVFFFAVIPPRLLEVLFLGFRCVLLGRKSVVQSLQWEVRVAVGWRLGRRLRGSVGEALAGLLPATGRAPEVPVLHAVHLPALSALSPRLPQADRPSGRG